MKKTGFIIVSLIAAGMLIVTTSSCDTASAGESYEEISQEVYYALKDDMEPLTQYSENPSFLSGYTYNPDTGDFTFSDESVSIVGTMIETETGMSTDLTYTMTDLTDGETTLNGTLQATTEETLSENVITVNSSQNGSITITGGTISTVSYKTSIYVSYDTTTYDKVSESTNGYIEIDGTKYSAESFANYEDEEDI